MARLLVITHPEVTVEPAKPVPDWGLTERGQSRAATFGTSDTFSAVTHIWSSAEQKARDTAAILSRARTLPVQINPRLGENDRSATGFLPPPLFEAAADAFFAEPETSFKGWETAVDAQARIVRAVRDITTQHTGGDLAIVTHGAVGTLLYCRLQGLAIDRIHDQPGQGHFWIADLTSLRPAHGWKPIA